MHKDEFSEARFSEAHVKEYDISTGELKEAEAERFGCVGKISVSPETKKIVKNCEGIESDSVTKTTKLIVTITGHINVEVLKKVFGLTNEGLADGIYGLNSDSKATPMLLTSEVTDIFTDKKKLVAYPLLKLTSGFAQEIDNSAEEIAEVELTFDALKDENGFFYYESMADKVTEDIKSKWLKQFTPDLVKPEAV